MASEDDMEEIEVATKAPESDAQPPPATADTEAKPVLGEHCVSDRATPSGSAPKGELTTLGGIDTYISTPSFYPSTPAKLLLLLSSGTGIQSTNNQLQADAWAEKGYVVILPDMFDGDAVPKMNATTSGSDQAPGTEPEPTSASSILDRIKLSLLETAKSFRIDMWLARHTPTTVLPRLVAVLEAATQVYADAVSFGDGIYGAGYCFGGRYVLLLLGNLPSDVAAGQREVTSSSTVEASAAGGEASAATVDLDAEKGMAHSGPWLKAAVLAHGTGIEKEDFAGLTSSASDAKGDKTKTSPRLGIAAVVGDALFNDEVREFGVKLAKEKGIEVQERIWEGVPHGFAVVGEYDNPNITRAQKEAFVMMSSFLEG